MKKVLTFIVAFYLFPFDSFGIEFSPRAICERSCEITHADCYAKNPYTWTWRYPFWYLASCHYEHCDNDKNWELHNQQCDVNQDVCKKGCQSLPATVPH